MEFATSNKVTVKFKVIDSSNTYYKRKIVKREKSKAFQDNSSVQLSLILSAKELKHF